MGCRPRHDPVEHAQISAVTWQAIPVPTPIRSCDLNARRVEHDQSQATALPRAEKLRSPFDLEQMNYRRRRSPCGGLPSVGRSSGQPHSGSKGALRLPSMEYKRPRDRTTFRLDGSTVVGWWEDPNGNGTRLGLIAGRTAFCTAQFSYSCI